MKKLKILFLFTAISLATLYSCTDNDSVQNEVETKKSFSLRTTLNELKKANNISGKNAATTPADPFCFEFVFPLNLSYNNGTVVSVSSINGILDLLINETATLYIEGIAFPFQVNVATADSANPLTINNEADFEALIESCGFENYEDYVATGICYDFVYPYSIVNQAGDTIVINSEAELFAEVSTTTGNDIYDLVFPISVTYQGQTVVLNTVYDLVDMDNNCVTSTDPCDCDLIYAPVCVATTTGIVEFPNACIAECEGFTVADFVNCTASPGPGFDGLGTCFTIQYPVEVQYQGALVAVNNDNELFSYANTTTGELPINYPITIISLATPTTPSQTYNIASEAALIDITATICN